jgi:hypothetical protein
MLTAELYVSSILIHKVGDLTLSFFHPQGDRTFGLDVKQVTDSHHNQKSNFKQNCDRPSSTSSTTPASPNLAEKISSPKQSATQK